MNYAKTSGYRTVRGSFFYLAPKEMVSFVRRDFEALRLRYRTSRWCYRGHSHGMIDRAAILRHVLWSDFNVSWFGYHQAYFAVRYSRKFGRKSVVILGGFDVCEEEDRDLPVRLGEIRYILQNADRLLAVSNRVREKALAIEPAARVDLVYHGFDADQFRPGGNKRGLVTTVAYVHRSHFRRKGLDTFVRTAALLPDYRFMMVGGWLDDSIDRLQSIATENVTFSGQVSNEELVRILQESAVYVQASTHESFGCSIAEAMLCSCVPVVSDRGAIPEVVGSAGIYVDPGSAEDVARGIRLAFSRPTLGAEARTRISTLFPAPKRQDRLLATIDELLK